MSMETKPEPVELLVRAELLNIFNQFASYFSQMEQSGLNGHIQLNWPHQGCVFQVTVFSADGLRRNRTFYFYVYDDPEDISRLAGDLFVAIDAGDFARIIELSGHDNRTTVQKYIDRKQAAA